MSPESNFITPPPSGEAAPIEPVPTPELITIPDNILAAQEQVRAEAANQQALFEQQAADAARQIIETAPGYEPNAEPVVAPQDPTVISTEGGRFGRGIVEAPMPADPSKVPGWGGAVKR